MTKRLPTLRILLTAHLSFAAIVWTVMLVGTFAILAAIHVTTGWDADRSVWHYMATQVSRWVAFFCGIDAIVSYLRPHVAHGRTRKDFLRQLWPYFVGLAAPLGLLITLGYLVERGVYGIPGWSQKIMFKASFGGAGNYLGIFGAYTLTLVLFAMAGALLAAAFSRGVLLGLVLIPFGVLLIAPSEVLVGLNGVPRFTELLEDLEFPQTLSIALAPPALVLAAVAMWAIVRRMPLLPKVV
jgi:hypothetical protein